MCVMDVDAQPHEDDNPLYTRGEEFHLPLSSPGIQSHTLLGGQRSMLLSVSSSHLGLHIHTVRTHTLLQAFRNGREHRLQVVRVALCSRNDGAGL